VISAHSTVFCILAVFGRSRVSPRIGANQTFVSRAGFPLSSQSNPIGCSTIDGSTLSAIVLLSKLFLDASTRGSNFSFFKFRNLQSVVSSEFVASN
jgi:hypothetical protein